MFMEKQHFSALIFSHPLIKKPIDLLGTILLGSFEAVEDVERSKSSFTHLAHYSKFPYKMTVEEAKAIELFKKKKKPNIITRGDHDEFLYDCYLKSIIYHIHDQPKFMFCTPIRQIMKKVIDSNAIKLESEKVTFYRLRLLAFCEYIEEHHELGMRVKRMNMQVHEGSEAHGAALYGKDVLRSSVYETLKDFATPTSLQIVYKNEQDKEVVFNVDGAGNWSFYLSVQKDIHVFGEAFRALGNAGLLKGTPNDPRRRGTDEERDRNVAKVR